MARDEDELLAFTVGTVWREERVSCPHPDVLRAYDTRSLDEGAMEFLAFHLHESQCPYCNAVLEDLRLIEQRWNLIRMYGSGQQSRNVLEEFLCLRIGPTYTNSPPLRPSGLRCLRPDWRRWSCRRGSSSWDR